MNEKLMELINGIGMMAELWSITFNSFKKQGLSDKDALKHTKEFMSVMMDSILERGAAETGGA